MSSEDQIKEPIWKVVLNIKPLRFIVQVSLILTILISVWTPIKPAFEYAKSKFNYMFAVKPNDKLLKQDKYSFWAGFTLFEGIHPSANTDDYLKSHFFDRQKLLKSLEVLGFDDRDTASIPDLQTFNFIERMAKNQGLRDRLEGFLKNRSNGNLELYKSGFALASLISELQASEVDRSKVQTLIKTFSLNWQKAQKQIDYKLVAVELNYSDDEYFVYSQPALMKNSINTLEAIRKFYGSI